MNCRSAYAASKHALQAFSDSLRAELARYNIKVSVISPGYIATALSVNALTGSGEAYGGKYLSWMFVLLHGWLCASVSCNNSQRTYKPSIKCPVLYILRIHASDIQISVWLDLKLRVKNPVIPVNFITTTVLWCCSFFVAYFTVLLISRLYKHEW